MTDYLDNTVDVVPAKEMDDLLKAVKSLISDIESMSCDAPLRDHDGSQDYWFGPFSEYADHIESVSIDWPNLAISLAAVKKLIEPQTIEGELTKPQITAEEARLKDWIIGAEP
jgi:hypothetical protein